jgi:serine/threonine-protein kinase
LNHANIATLHSLEEHEGKQFLVMELVEGETLGERIPLTVDEAVPLFIQIADGLEAAHEKGIVHRDLKPANIKIGPDGKPKILDFGLARASATDNPDSPQAESPTVTRHTEGDVILGTAPYMSPEQARGKVAGKRADVWAFGCCLYEALTGKAAFFGETVSDTIAAILDREPDWERLPGGTPTGIRRLLRRCLQKDYGRRLEAIGDARIELEEVETGEDPEAVAAPVKRPGALAFALVAIGAALVTMAVYRSFETEVRPRAVTRSILPLAPGSHLASLRFTPSLAISPDGQRVAYIAQSGESRRLYLRALDQLSATPVEGSEGARTPFFSPDGRWVGFYAEGSMKRAPVGGGATLAIAPLDAQSRGSSWGAGGAIVYTPTYVSGLSRISAEGGERVIVTELDRERRETSHRLPQVLPRGDEVLFTVANADLDTFDDAEIATVVLDTGKITVQVKGGTNARYSPSGHLVYARDGALFAAAFDLDTLQIEGEPVRVLEGIASDTIYGSAQFALSREGTLLYAPGDARGYERRLMWVDRDGRSRPLTESRRAFNAPRLSPDGTTLAVHIEGANDSIWVQDLERGTLSRVVSGFTNGLPVWSPDGHRLAFRSNRHGRNNVFVVAADGSDQPAPVTRSDHDQLTGSWSPVGNTLAFSEFQPDTLNDIWTVSMAGDGEPVLFLRTEFDELLPRFSPDGRWMVHQSNASGRNEIYVVSFPSPKGKRQVSTDGGTQPVWSPVGNELFYRNGHRMMVVDVKTEGEGQVVFGSPRLLFEGDFLGEYDVARDGQRFVMIQELEPNPPPNHLILVQNFGEELRRLVPVRN